MIFGIQWTTRYYPKKGTSTSQSFVDSSHLVSLSGIRTGNKTETFVGFIIYIYNESADKPSGHFVTPLPQGVQKEECHFEIPRDETVRKIYSRTSVTRILKGRVSGDSSNRGRLVIQFVVF